MANLGKPRKLGATSGPRGPEILALQNYELEKKNREDLKIQPNPSKNKPGLNFFEG